MRVASGGHQKAPQRAKSRNAGCSAAPVVDVSTVKTQRPTQRPRLQIINPNAHHPLASRQVPPTLSEFAESCPFYFYAQNNWLHLTDCPRRRCHGGYAWWTTQGDVGHYLSDLRIELAVNDGVNNDRGNLLGIEPDLSPATIRAFNWCT